METRTEPLYGKTASALISKTVRAFTKTEKFTRQLSDMFEHDSIQNKIIEAYASGDDALTFEQIEDIIFDEKNT